MKDRVEQFLERHCLDADLISLDDICNRFLFAMKAGLEGKDSPLAMIPSYCSPECDPQVGQTVIAIDAGGTNLRTCLVSFDKERRPVVSDFQKNPMPGTRGEVSADEFFDQLADNVERLIDKSDRIGFCFSYAAQILPDHDGVPFSMSKEIKAPEVNGKHLGKELLAKLAKRGHDVSAKKLIVLNDTVTTLLAAQAMNTGGSYDGCIGFILGTGTNTAYIEKNCNIKKISMPEGSQIINVESGFMDLVLGDIDRKFIESTINPESSRFEKMIGGAYLGPLASLVIRTAIEEGLFSDSFSREFEKINPISSADISAFLNEDEDSRLYLCARDEKDYDTLMEILGAFVDRVAKLTAANLASAVLATDFGRDEDHPVLINADGTTFYKTAFLKSCTYEYLDAYLAEKGRRAVLTQIDNSPIIGSAIGALSL